MKVKYFTEIDRISALTEKERVELKQVTDKFSFRVNDYYLSLINWDDPDDPIRRIVIPTPDELQNWGDLDASNEAANYVVPGCQHKYRCTALIIVTEFCGAYCRFCFRKRLFMEENNEVSGIITGAIEYIRNHPEINNVLLTGGDALVLSTKNLEKVLSELRSIKHVKIIRIGTKMLAFNPDRITNDTKLLRMISRYSSEENRIYFMSHFNHPREITAKSMAAVDKLVKAGAIINNQTPILRGINDNPDVLAELMRKLTDIGVPPYYFFQCRPTAGNKTYAVSIVESYMAVERAKMNVSGLARRAKFVMSHASGKIEIVGVTRSNIYLKYHRARNPNDESRFIVCQRYDSAYWLDDLTVVGEKPKEQSIPIRYFS
jgi:KamA family protein